MSSGLDAELAAPSPAWRSPDGARIWCSPSAHRRTVGNPFLWCALTTPPPRSPASVDDVPCAARVCRRCGLTLYRPEEER